MSRFIISIIISINLLHVGAQETSDDLRIFDYLEPLEQANIFKTEGYYNWGASIIKGIDDKYHLFYSRWKKDYSFYGWLTHSEVAHAVSDKPTGPWNFLETVLTGRGPGYWDAVTAHNPKIKYFDGKYYLYYISTNFGEKEFDGDDLVDISNTGYSHEGWKILRPNQRTGVAIAKSLNGPWTRGDEPLIHPTGPITTLTVNPAIAKGDDDFYYLIVKGDKPNEKRFIRNQALAKGRTPSGPFSIQDVPVIDYMDTEDMSMWYDKNRKRFYSVFHAHDYIGMLTSEDGSTWRSANEPVLSTKTLKLADGQVIHPDRLERPFIYEEDGDPMVLSLAVKKEDESYTVFIPINKPKRPLPNFRQVAWQEAEFGVVFHYDLHVFDGLKYGQGNNRVTPMPDYQIFNPEKLDTDQWVKAAKDAGAKFALITATHETGFALFQSKVNPYCLKAVDWRDGKGDIVRDFIASCRKYGIKPGVYIGIRWNSFLGVHDFKINGEGEFRENRQSYYNQLVEGMVKEICTNYGALFEIWFDGGAGHPYDGTPDVLPIVRKYQPNCLFYHNGQLAEARWGGSESGMMSYPNWSTFPYPVTGAGEQAKSDMARNNFQLLKQGDPSGKYWVPAMADAPLRGYNGRHEWFWEPGDEAHIFPLKNLMDIYYNSVGRNSTLIMGLTPDADGLLPEPDVNRLQEWGNEIGRRFNDPIETLAGTGLEFQMDFVQPTKVNHLIIQEDLRLGENIHGYKIEGWSSGEWNELSNGSCVGQKRIDQFETTIVTKLRFLITDYIEQPVIKKMAAYFVDDQH